MGQRLKKLGCYILIIILLPYVVTVFINGPSSVSSSQVDSTDIRVKTEAGEIQMPIEEYCIGILAKEIPADYEEEALKAQAVLVRTDIYEKLQSGGTGTALEEEFWDREQMEEAWGMSGYSRNYKKLQKAWEATEGQVLTYEGNLAKTPFFRLSNGSTRDGKEVLGEEYPYLKIADCPLDIEAPEQIQTVTIDALDAEVTKSDTAGYVLSVRVGEETVSGEEFRETYHLASSCFTLQKYNGKVRITTRGVGHGLGMSQYTAGKMAEENNTFEEILAYFFPGTKIKEVADIVQSEEGGEEASQESAGKAAAD